MELVVVRGGGDIATGIVYRLHKAGFRVIVLDIENPTSIRRKVSFSEAIYDGEIVVEGLRAVFARNLEEAYKITRKGYIAVCIDENGELIGNISPKIVVDSILAKRNLGTNRNMAYITIGIGPGFEAGVDVDFVVESNRGHCLGKVIYEGRAEENTGIPGDVLGYSMERVIRAENKGIFNSYFDIGDRIEKGQTLGDISGVKIKAKISGILRGVLKDGLYVDRGFKIGDIDPRGIGIYAYTISEKARAIGGGVLEAIMYKCNRENFDINS